MVATMTVTATMIAVPIDQTLADPIAIDPRNTMNLDVGRFSLTETDPKYVKLTLNPGDRRSRRSPSSSPSSSPPPRRKPKRRKSLTQQAMGAMGALGIGNALTGEKDAHPRRHRSDSRGAGRRRRNRSSSSSSSRSRSRDGRVSGGHGHGLDQQQIAQAVKAALTAGATEAYRARKEPGGWTGAKGKRIITAAIASGGADSAMDSNPNKHGKRHVIESALAGLATNHALNGPRSRGGSRDGRGHSSKGGAVKGIATSGALLAAGKEIYDHLQSSRSKSRGRDRSSSSSSDGRDPRDRRRGGEKKKRSKSLSDYVSQGLAAVGLHDDVDDKHHEKPRRHGRGERERSSRHDGPYDSDSEPYDSEAGFRPKRRGYGGSDGNPRDVGRELPGSQNPNTALSKYERRGAVAPYHPPHTPQKDNDNDSDSDLGSSSDEENTRKKMARRQVLKTGMATVASVHAAHTVVGSMKKRKKRLTAIQKGEIDPEVAHNQRWKNYAMDAASVGLAAMSVHGAVGEWKDAKSKREACQKFKEDAEHRATKRQGKRSKSFG